ncbi:MAG TPA: YncE family protein [Candidatus Binatia bacterium]|nr:YncE family protein [Candidatus Binatia bacterium]
MAQVVLATVASDYAPFGVAINANKVYVTNQCGIDPFCGSTGTVTVIDQTTLSTTSIPVGVLPYLLAVNSNTNTVYVVNNNCNSYPDCNGPGSVTAITGTTQQTVNVGYSPYGIAVNPSTNKIYVANQCGDDPSCQAGTVTVIDGATLTPQSVTVGVSPYGVAVNPSSNKIYVVNTCGNDPTCQSDGTVTQIDGNNLNNIRTVNVSRSPYDVAVNTSTNKIYVDNYCGTDPTCLTNGTVTVIDDSTLSTESVAVGSSPYDVKVNSATNRIYVANAYGDDPSGGSGGTVTVIDGATRNTTTVATGAFPVSEAIDQQANRIYVANLCGTDPNCYSTGGIVTVIDGATNQPTPVAVGDYPWNVAVDPSTNRAYVPNNADDSVSVIGGDAKLQLRNVPPCRLVDTRPQYGGSGPIQGGTYQNFLIPQLGGCNIPPSAVAYALNVTVVPQGPLGYLTIWPAAEIQPNVSTMNSLDGRIKAEGAIVPAGVNGAVSVFASNTTDVVLDINGYFAPADAETYQFFPLAPCRVIDTRNADGDLGGPFLPGGHERDFPVQESSCIPSGSNPAAYSFNVTVVPHRLHQSLGYLTMWPQGQPQPGVSTLNNLTATTVANAAIVPAGSDGVVAVFPSNDTDLVVDINGYFAVPAEGGLSMYPAPPCRVIDTRDNNGQPFSQKLTVNVTGSSCAPPASALAYIFNATVVPVYALGYLTLWPDGQEQPAVSTLNAVDGWITSNMAIVPTTNGSIDAYASNLTQLILDISGYFAP